MPFPSQPEPQPERPVRQYDNSNLLTVGGLYDSASGKAIRGNINLGYTRKGEDQSVGEKLLAMVQECLDEGRPMTFLVFQGDSKYPNSPPYRLCVDKGQFKSPNTGTPPLVEEQEIPRPIRRTAPRR